jgi:hypothetical protein
MGGACSRYGGEEMCIQGFGEETLEKRPLGRPRRRLEANIKMNLQEVVCGGIDLIEGLGLVQMAGTCECGNEPPGIIKCGEFLD